MYGKSAKTWKVIGIIGIILAVCGTIACAIVNLQAGVSVGELIMLIVLGPFLMMLGYSSLIINFKKIMIGLISPIPIVSMLIEYFKGIVAAIRGYIWMFKNPNGEASQD